MTMQASTENGDGFLKALSQMWKPEELCVDCDDSSSMMLKRRGDLFAVPVCGKHAVGEHIVLVKDDVQGFHYEVTDD